MDSITKPGFWRVGGGIARGGPLWAALLVTLLALGVYAAAAAPGLALTAGGADGAELAVAVHTLGIPHPTGYPTYVLLAQAARALPWGALAGRLSLFSALAAALAAGVVALAAGELFPGEERRWSAFTAALTAGLTLAAAGLFGSQAVIAEVYTLHTLFLALAAWLLLRWRRRGGLSLPLAGLCLGLGLGNHVSLAFVAAGAAAFLLVPTGRPRRRGRVEAGVGEAFPADSSPGCFEERSGDNTGSEVSEGQGLAPTDSPQPGAAAADDPRSAAAPPPHPGLGAFPAHALRRPTRGELLGALGALLAGLLVYLYLPLRAAADPWLNWGDPRTFAAFWAHVSGAAYRHYLFQVPWAQALGRLSAAANLLLRDMGPHGALLGVAGAIVLGRRDRAALLLPGIPAGLGLLLAVTYGGADAYVHLLPLYVAWALWAGVGAGTAAVLLHGRWGRRAALAALLLPLLGLPMLARGWGGWNQRAVPVPVVWAEALAALPADGILLTNADEYTFPLWYLQVVEGKRPDAAVVDVRLLEWAWYRRQLPTRYAGLVVPEEGGGDWLRAFLEANAGRPALAVEGISLPAGYRLRNAGPLHEVVPPLPLIVPC